MNTLQTKREFIEEVVYSVITLIGMFALLIIGVVLI